MRHLIVLLLIALCVISCNQKPNRTYKLLDAQAFKTTLKGKDINLYTLTNKSGMAVQLTNYGARLVSIWAPDKNGDYADINLGFATGEAYLNANGPFFGAVIGRYANRISKGRFVIEKDTFQLAINNGANNIHGGPKGFSHQVWEASQLSDDKIELSYLSVDGDQGFPGELKTKVVYELTNNNALKMTISATTNKTTIVNFCNHAFFNLAGEANGSAMENRLYVNADAYTPLDSQQIPTGEFASVISTPYDFKTPTVLSSRIEEPFEQLVMGEGYDINYVLNKKGNELSHAATLTEPESGRMMEVYTTEPGMQLYTANFLNGSDMGKFNKPLKYREAVCLETQHFPDSPNQENFPSTELKPGNTFETITVYKFGITN